MLLSLPALLIATASAYEPPNWQVLVHVDVVHAFGAEHPWGVRLGADLSFAVGDQCDQEWPGWETECHTSVVWPVAGPGLSFAWLGKNRFFVELDGLGGVAGLEVATHGFWETWKLAARLGFRVRTGPGGVGFVMGGHGSKSFGLTVTEDDGSFRIYGTHVAGLRLDFDAVLRVTDDGWDPPVLGGGVWYSARPVYSVVLL